MIIDKCAPKPGDHGHWSCCNSKLADGTYEHSRIVVKNGCIVSVEAGEPFVYTPQPCGTGGGGGIASPVSVADTPTVDMSGDGTNAAPIMASIKASGEAGNQLKVRTDGLYVPTPAAGNAQVATTNTPSVTLSGTGATSSPLSAAVKVAPVADNTLQPTADGLYVPPASISLSSAASQLTTSSSGRLLTEIKHLLNSETGGSPIVTQGYGNDFSKLYANLLLAPEQYNALVVHQQSDGSYALYSQEELNKGYKVTGLIPGSANVGYMFVNIKDKQCFGIFPVQWTVFQLSGPPTLTVTGTVTISGAGSGSLTNGQVSNLYPFAARCYIPTGYTWQKVGTWLANSSTPDIIETRRFTSSNGQVVMAGYRIGSAFAVDDKVDGMVIAVGLSP